MREQTTCACCGRGFERDVGRGRPRRFCGAACKRITENDLRRLTRMLEQLDNQVLAAERHVRGIGFSGHPDVAQRRLIELLRQQAETAARYDAYVRRIEGSDE